MTLLELLYDKSDRILRDAANSLIRADLPHYKKFKDSDIKARYKKLLYSVTICAEKNSCSELSSYMNHLSDERFSMGFEPTEVQAAINILEEALWKNIYELVDGDKQNSAMKQITEIMGRAKLELIGEYAMLERS
ncbi:MAG TPA: hypothetical protein PK605_08125 [Ignavibacteria bacterium]|nr:hypothetical protein [Bacteroidota bacterium]HRE09462.1 hypothetical protein [Ignavibacteria bacterium]HRF64586.1 hypothetical protein [Ignavibacteria bacterium]HRJ04355.1 hypothetical protein [Ignavibacteria bacterium]HRJ86886.1 hypothetical protein [Ignavibacteria bacterium]